MSWKNLAWSGAGLLVAGISTLLIGAFVLTTDARHHDISPVVGVGFWMAVAGVLALVMSGVGLLVRRLQHNSRQQFETIAAELLQDLEKQFPFEKYVDIFGFLHCDQWLRALEQFPAALADLKPLVERARSDTRSDGWSRHVGDIVACIRRHPSLDRRVTMERKIQFAHFLRQGLFRRVPHPEAKEAEWKVLLENLNSLLGRRVGPNSEAQGYHLVRNEVDEPGHKIELSNPELLTPELLKDIQTALKGFRNTWYVILQLDFDQTDPKALPAMLTVWADHVDEAWDKEQLREVLGARFKL